MFHESIVPVGTMFNQDFVALINREIDLILSLPCQLFEIERSHLHPKMILSVNEDPHKTTHEIAQLFVRFRTLLVLIRTWYLVRLYIDSIEPNYT